MCNAGFFSGREGGVLTSLGGRLTSGSTFFFPAPVSGRFATKYFFSLNEYPTTWASTNSRVGAGSYSGNMSGTRDASLRITEIPPPDTIFPQRIPIPQSPVRRCRTT